MNILDYILICMFIFLVGWVIGWETCRAHANRVWNNLLPDQLEDVAQWRRVNWPEERKYSEPKYRL